MDRFEKFLQENVPREMPIEGQVDVRVARALAWFIASRPDGDQSADQIESYAVKLEQLGCIDLGNRSAAAFVRDALAFVRDEQRHRDALHRRIEGGDVDDVKEQVA